MAANLEPEELENVLKHMLKQMMDKGLIPKLNADQQKQVIQTITPKFEKELDKKNIFEKTMQKAIYQAIISATLDVKQGLNLDPKLKLKFDDKILFDEKNPEMSKKAFTEELERILNLRQQLKPTYPAPDCKKEAEDIANKIDFEFEKPFKNEKVLDALIVLESANLTLYGATKSGIHVEALSGIAAANPTGTPTEKAAEGSGSILGDIEKAMDELNPALQNLVSPALKSPFDLKPPSPFDQK